MKSITALSKERLERAAMLGERFRLARELHDGVLQSLTGATLQLEALTRLIDEDPEAARMRLRSIEDLIADEQRELRSWIQNLKPTARPSMVSNTELAEVLEKLCRRIEWQWGIRVQLAVHDCGAIPRILGDEIFRLLQEALSNIGRHAHAQLGRVEVETVHGCVRLVIADDGSGFPFRGRYDLAALTAKHVGPVSLKERVTSLHGELVLTSTLSGSRLEISLPLPPAPLTATVSGHRRALRAHPT